MAATTQVNSANPSSDRLTDILKKAGASNLMLDILANRFEFKLPPLSDFTGSTVTPPASRTAPANSDKYDELRTPHRTSSDPAAASTDPAKTAPLERMGAEGAKETEKKNEKPARSEDQSTESNDSRDSKASEAEPAPQKSGFRTKIAIVLAGVGLLVGGYFYARGKTQPQPEGSSKPVATNVVDGAQTTNAPFRLLSDTNSFSPLRQNTLPPLLSGEAATNATQGSISNAPPVVPTDKQSGTNAATTLTNALAKLFTGTNSGPTLAATNTLTGAATNAPTVAATNAPSVAPPAGLANTNSIASGAATNAPGATNIAAAPIPGLNPAPPAPKPEPIPAVAAPDTAKATNAPAASPSPATALRNDFSAMPQAELRELVKRYQTEAVNALRAGKLETEAIAIAADLAKKEGYNIDALTAEFARRNSSQAAPPAPTATKALVTDFSSWPDRKLIEHAAKYKAKAQEVISAGGKESDALAAAAALAAKDGNNIDYLVKEIDKRNQAKAAKSAPTPSVASAPAQAAATPPAATPPPPAPASPTDYKAMSTDQLRNIVTPYYKAYEKLVASGKTPDQAEEEIKGKVGTDGHDYEALMKECNKRQEEQQRGAQQSPQQTPASQPAPAQPAAAQPPAASPPVSAPAATSAPATFDTGRAAYQPREIPAPTFKVTPIEQRKTDLVVPVGSPKATQQYPDMYKPRPADFTPKFTGKQQDLKQLNEVRTAYINAAKKSGQVNPQDSKAVWHKAVELAANDGTDLNAVSLHLATGQLKNSTSARGAIKTTDPLVPTDQGGLQWVGQKKLGDSYDAILSEDGSVVVDQRRAKFLGIPLPWKRTVVADGIDKKQAKALLAAMEGKGKTHGGI